VAESVVHPSPNTCGEKTSRSPIGLGRVNHHETADQFANCAIGMNRALMNHADRIRAVPLRKLDAAAGTVAGSLRDSNRRLAKPPCRHDSRGAKTHRRTLLNTHRAMTIGRTRQSEQDSTLRDALKRLVDDRTKRSRIANSCAGRRSNLDARSRTRCPPSSPKPSSTVDSFAVTASSGRPYETGGGYPVATSPVVTSRIKNTANGRVLV